MAEHLEATQALTWADGQQLPAWYDLRFNDFTKREYVVGIRIAFFVLSGYLTLTLNTSTGQQDEPRIVLLMETKTPLFHLNLTCQNIIASKTKGIMSHSTLIQSNIL